MLRVVGDIIVVTLQTIALIVFSASAPLAHLHPGQETASHAHPHEAGGEHEPHRGVTFHTHLDGHPHATHSGSFGKRHGDGNHRDESLTISHGRLVSPRVELPSQPPTALALTVDVVCPWVASRLVDSDTRYHVPRPPLLFRKPARAPPFTS